MQFLGWFGCLRVVGRRLVVVITPGLGVLVSSVAVHGEAAFGTHGSVSGRIRPFYELLHCLGVMHTLRVLENIASIVDASIA